MWLRCGFIAPDRKKKKKKREYSPIRGLIQEKATMWIWCDFCFYGNSELVIQSEDFLKEKPQSGLNVAFGFYGYCNAYTNQSPR